MSEKESKRQILKSTGIFGSAQVLIILANVVRVKVLAVLLGATGVGISGLYQTTIDLLKSATGFGLGYSAIRDIAASAASEDEVRIATTVAVLRRWVWVTGLLGTLIALVFCRQLSLLAFGTTDYALGIAVLSLGCLLSAVAAGQSALLQGLRKISSMAKANVFNAIVGLLLTSAIYYFFGLKGIVPALLTTFVLSVLVNGYFTRQIKTAPVSITTAEVYKKGKAMITLGFFLSFVELAGTATMYLVRTYIMKKGGVDSVGYFVAAWSISSVYISAIFGAMGADFFPRLSGVQHDPVAVTKLVNEQSEVAILITAPIIIGMISFIQLIIHIVYSRDFTPTAGILDWQLMGDFFRVLSWPMGLIILATGKGKRFVITELCWNLLFCGGVYFGWQFIGIQVTGVAFFVTHLFYMCLIFYMANKLVNFRWSYKVRNAILFFLPLVLLSFLSVKFLQQPFQYIVGAALTLIAALFSFSHLKAIIDLNAILKKFKIIQP